MGTTQNVAMALEDPQGDCAALVLQHGADALLAELAAPHRALIPPAIVPHLAEWFLDGAAAPRPVSSFSSPTRSRLRTGIASIDAALHGGLPLSPGGMLVEVHGSAAAGKTQFCLQLCAGGDVRAVYVVTAGRFPGARFRQMARPKALDAVIVEKVSDVDGMETWAEMRLPWLLRTTGARLVIVDCIASLYRPAFERGAEIERARSLVRVTALLKEATAAMQGVVVCVNQVSARPGKARPIPALGGAWGRCCNTRLEVRRELGAEKRRCVTVMHSSFARSGSAGSSKLGHMDSVMRRGKMSEGPVTDVFVR